MISMKEGLFVIQRYLHKNKIFRRAVRKKIVVREVNKKERLLPSTLHKVPTPYHVMHPQIITDTFLWYGGHMHSGAGNINTPQELFIANPDIWMNFTVDYIQNLYTSIPRVWILQLCGPDGQGHCHLENDKVCRQNDGLKRAKDDYQGCHDISQHLYYHQPYNLHWNQVIFSNESQIVIGQNNLVYVWRSSNEAYRPECMWRTTPPSLKSLVISLKTLPRFFFTVLNNQTSPRRVTSNMWRNFKVVCYVFTNKQTCFQDGSQGKGTDRGSETTGCGFETGRA
jgi:hypothetical protein